MPTSVDSAGLTYDEYICSGRCFKVNIALETMAPAAAERAGLAFHLAGGSEPDRARIGALLLQNGITVDQVTAFIERVHVCWSDEFNVIKNCPFEVLMPGLVYDVDPLDL